MAYIVCTSNLDIVSFLFVPALYSTALYMDKHECSHCSLLWCENGIVYQQVIRTFVSYHLFTKFHTSKHLGKRVGQTCIFTLFFCCAKTVLFTNKYQNISLIPTSFVRVTLRCIFTLFVVV